MEKLLDILTYLRKRVFYLDGLVTALVLAGGLWCSMAKAVGPHLLHVARACGWSAADDAAHVCFVVGFAAALFSAFLFWRHSRSVPRFAKDELGIIFAPDFDEDVKKEVDRLFVHLKQDIKSRELGNRFALKRLPPNLSISSPSEASQILGEARGAVAVWGPLEQQSDPGGTITGFSKISITFVLRAPRLRVSRLESLAMPLVGRQLHVRERTLIADRKVMARDIGLMVRNVLGVALLLGHSFEEAIKVLGPLHADLQLAFPLPRSVPLQRFCLQVRYDLAYSLTMSTGKQYLRFLPEGKVYEIPRELLEGWLRNVDQAISLDRQNSVHYLAKAIYLFVMGNVDGAIGAEKKAERHAPRAASIANFGLAFLYNFKGNFKLSRQQYRVGLAKKTSYDEGMISQCLAFTRQSIARFADKKQLRLALGVLELERGSRERGIEAVEEFLADPPGGPELQEFVGEGRRLLQKAKSEGQVDGIGTSRAQRSP